MACKTIGYKKWKLCTSNLKNKIVIQYPASISLNSPDSNVGSSFIEVFTAWSMVKTRPSRDGFFDQVNLANSLNIDFYIRYTTQLDIDREIWVLFNDRRYKVEIIENIEELNKTYRLGAVVKGPQSIAANQR